MGMLTAVEAKELSISVEAQLDSYLKMFIKFQEVGPEKFNNPEAMKCHEDFVNEVVKFNAILTRHVEGK